MDALAGAAKPLAHPLTPRGLFLVLMAALCFASSNLQLASSQGSSDSCSNGLSLGSIVPFNTTGLTCFRAWPSQGFILRLGKAATSNDVWSFVLSAPDNGGYISIGFSPTGRMVGSSAVPGWVTFAGAGSARRYYLGGTSSRACPPDQGKLTLVGAPSVVSKGSRLYLAFQLAGQPLTDVVYAVGPSGSFPGSNGLLPRHQDMASGTISLSGSGRSGGGSPATGAGDGDDGGGEDGEGKGKESKRSGKGSGDDDDEEEGERPHVSPASSASSTGKTAGGGLRATRRHGVLAATSWGAVVPAGVALARSLKRHDPLWFYAHVAAQGIGSVLGVVAVVAGFKLDDDDGPGVAAHKAVGIAVLVCACLQLMAVLARPAKETKARRYWNWYHHNVGRAAVVFGVANALYGLSLAGERQEWSYVYGILAGVFVVVCLVLEEWRRRQ